MAIIDTNDKRKRDDEKRKNGEHESKVARDGNNPKNDAEWEGSVHNFGQENWNKQNNGNLKEQKHEPWAAQAEQNEQEQDDIHVYCRWEEMCLKEELLRGIFQFGFERPSCIQSKAIMPIIDGKDIRAQAQSGTGKTAAFGISALQILTGAKRTEIMIIVTTREIAHQNANTIQSLSIHMNVDTAIVAGGSSVNQTIRDLENNPHIVVGTPGRMLHMISQGYLYTGDLKLLIIDEADEMLKLGFNDQLHSIIEYIKPETQVAMFSATWDTEAINVSNNILNQPLVDIKISQDELTLKGINQFYVDLGQEPDRGADMIKFHALYELYNKFSLSQSVVFVNTRNKAKFLFTTFSQKSVPCDMIHADLDQAQRERVMKQFRDGNLRLLIATSVIARGVNIHQLSIVFNFDIPPIKEKNDYIHRIGRVGRFGKQGVAINFVFKNEISIIQQIERYYNTSIPSLPNVRDFSDLTKHN